MLAEEPTDRIVSDKADRARAYQREYYQKNKDRIVKKNRAWADKNKVKLQKYHHDYGKRNRSRMLDAARRYRARNVDLVRVNALKSYYKTYPKVLARRCGIPLADVVDFMARYPLDSARCHICMSTGEEKRVRLHLDHCHRTKMIRGWLCGKCNRALGFLGDSLPILRKAVAYLEKFDARAGRSRASSRTARNARDSGPMACP